MLIVNEETEELQCVFCKIGKPVITIVDKKTKKETKLKKEDAIKDYKIYINKLYEKPNVQNLIKPKGNIIMP